MELRNKIKLKTVQDSRPTVSDDPQSYKNYRLSHRQIQEVQKLIDQNINWLRYMIRVQIESKVNILLENF